MPRYTPFSMIRVMVPAIYAICFHATPVHQGQEQPPSVVPSDTQISFQPVLLTSVFNYSPASIVAPYVNPAPLAVDPIAAIAYSPNETVTSASHFHLSSSNTVDVYPLVTPKLFDNISPYAKDAFNHIHQEKGLALALAIPIFFLPVLFLFSSIATSLGKAICGTPPTSIMDILVFQGLDAYAKDNSGVVAFVTLLRRTISPSNRVSGRIGERGCLKAGLIAAFEDVICMVAIGAELVNGINYFGEDPYAYRWIGLAMFWFGLSAFLRGCDLADETPDSSTLTTHEVSGLGQIHGIDCEEADTDEEATNLDGFEKRDRSELLDSDIDGPPISKKAERNKKKRSRKAKAKATDYDADAESNIEEVPEVKTPSIIKRPKLNRTLSLDKRIAELDKSLHLDQRSSGSPQDTPPKDKKNRPLIHPCVRDILGSERFQRLVNRKRRSHSIVNKAEGSKEKSMPDIPNIDASENDVSSSPVTAPFSSTPRDAQFAPSRESSPSIWSPSTGLPVHNIASPTNSDVFTAIFANTRHAPLVCTPDESETSSRIPLSGSADSLNTTIDISREWAPYAGDDKFVLGVQAKAAVTSVVEEVEDRDGQILKLCLGTGVFINERGTEVSCLRPMGLPRPDYLQRLDTDAAPSEQDEVRKMSSFKFPRAPLAALAVVPDENVDIMGNTT